jgi:hypothetical protein
VKAGAAQWNPFLASRKENKKTNQKTAKKKQKTKQTISSRPLTHARKVSTSRRTFLFGSILSTQHKMSKEDEVQFSSPAYSYVNHKVTLRKIPFGIGMFANEIIKKDEVIIGWSGTLHKM